MIRKTIVLLATGIALFGFNSCRKQLDINQNPNVGREVTPALILPTAQLEISTGLGVFLNNTGSFWVQHWTQNPSASQYITLNRYQPNAADFDRPWTLLYSGALTDLDQTYQRAVAGNQRQYQAIALLLKAYTFQLITDAWGDVPYTESLLGLPQQEGQTGILNPRFDPQQTVYNGIIQMAQQGMDLIDPNDPIHPGSDDLVYGGDMELWERFGNTLLLRIYMRMSERSPSMAQAGVAALYANNIGFLEDGEDAQIIYSSTTQNPLYLETRSLGQNQIASTTVGDSMNANADPRRTVLFATTGNVVGAQQGQTVSTPGVSYTTPGSTTGANTTAGAASGPVRLLTAYESYFLQAEAAARGWAGAGASDNTLFMDAIRASFSHLGLTAAAATTYMSNAYWAKYPAGGTTTQKLRHIITQKWFAMTGIQGFEAWTEWRRTGYPDFLQPSIGNSTNGIIPTRFLYPDVEISRNANFPGQRFVVEKVWWDAN